MALKVAEMRSMTSTKISFFSPRRSSRSAIGLCTAFEDIVFGADLSALERMREVLVPELETAAGSLKTKA
jgi:glucose-6-phosphate isomerase